MHQALLNFPIIDSHHHFWDLSLGMHPWLSDQIIKDFRYGDYSGIRNNYLLDNYMTDTIDFNIAKTVHVEAEWNSNDPVGETRWLTNYFDQTGFPSAIVGQVWFQRDDIEEVLRGHCESPLIRSVRQKPIAAPSFDQFVPAMKGSLADPSFRNGFKLLKKYNLHFDLQTPWWHLHEAADLARDFPDTLIILNHMGLPSDRSLIAIDRWREKMEIFADQPNTVVKVSGICMPEVGWSIELNRELVLDTLRIFGNDRCMFGSNFPVDKLHSSFDRIFIGFSEITRELPYIDRKRLFHDNALIHYNLV